MGQILINCSLKLDGTVVSLKDVLKMVRRQKALNFELGTAHLYSNTGYNLLAAIVEVVTGDSFREWTDANIFKPLNMVNSLFCDDHEMILKNRAYAYQAVENDGFKHVVNNTTAVGDGHFLGDSWLFPEVHFTRDSSGHVTGFRLIGDRVRNLRFEKKRH